MIISTSYLIFEEKGLHKLKVQLKKEIEQIVHLQDYAGKPTIEGVKVITLRRHNDDGGSFTELARITNGDFSGVENFKIAQINFSEMEPQSVKAFHVHRQQTDIWFVPPDSKILLILIDLRENSATNGQRMRLVIGDNNSQLIVIPPGVAHGCKNLGLKKAHLIYFMNKQFSPEPSECDEWRLPWDYFGGEIWEVNKG